jgi:hypothetical protein
VSVVLSPTQIYQLALKHGFSPQEATMVTAIAGQESQGRTDAFNPQDSHGGSVGLMQINGANAALLGGGNWRKAGEDPDASMAAAHALYARRGNFKDWGGYTDGGYKKYLNQAVAASGVAPGTSLTSAPGHPHTLTPSTAGPEYTPTAVAAANPVPAAPPPPTFSEAAAKGDVGGMFKSLITKPPPKKDAQGNEVEQKSTLENVASAFGGKGGEERGPAPIPEMPAAPVVTDPTPGLAPAAQQLWSTVAQAAARPLSWTSDPYGSNAGLQRIRQGGGTTLNNTGYGYDG